MSINLFKVMAGPPLEAKKKQYEETFSSMEEATKFVEEKILPIEIHKYVSFNMSNISSRVKKLREYLFVDDTEEHIYSYRIIETNE